MTPLVANLKHFYQSKKLLFWGIFISGFCLWLMFLDEQKFDLDAVDLGEMSSFFSGMSVVLAFLGVLAAEHQRHIFSKPFVSFLPGHHRAAWRVLFLIGCIVSVVLCLVELLRVATIQLNAEVLGMVGCACVLGFVCYTLGVFLVFPCGVGGIVPFFLLVSNKWAKPENLRYCLVDHPYMSVSVSCVALVAFWVWFACNKNLVKYCCERPYYGFMSNTKVKSQKTAVEEIMPPIPKSRYADRLERYCQNRMLQAPMFSMPRTLWGCCIRTGYAFDATACNVHYNFYVHGVVDCAGVHPGAATFVHPDALPLFLFANPSPRYQLHDVNHKRRLHGVGKA